MSFPEHPLVAPIIAIRFLGLGCAERTHAVRGMENYPVDRVKNRSLFE